MIDRNTLYPNIRQIAANVRNVASTAPCEICGDEAAKPYVFAYGKRLRQESSSSYYGGGTKTITTTYYGSLNARAVHLCANCVDRHRRDMAGRVRAMIILFVLVSLALITTVVVMPGDQVVLTIFAVLSPFVALFFGVRLDQIQKKPEWAGLDKAMKLHLRELQKEGYDSFWRDPEDPGSI